MDHAASKEKSAERIISTKLKEVTSGIDEFPSQTVDEKNSRPPTQEFNGLYRSAQINSRGRGVRSGRKEAAAAAASL